MDNTNNEIKPTKKDKKEAAKKVEVKNGCDTAHSLHNLSQQLDVAEEAQVRWTSLPTCRSFTCFLDLLLFNQVYSKIGRRNEPSQVSCLTALTTITILQDHHHHRQDHRQG